MKYFIVTVFLLFSSLVFSQNLFLLSSENQGFGSQTSISMFNIEDCTISLVYTLDTIFENVKGTPFALASRNDSVLFIINSDATIFEINILSQSNSIVYAGNQNVFYNGVIGAVYDNEQNKLFLSGKGLFSYDIETAQLTDHGLFNASEIQGIDDLVFHEGKLIGTGGSFTERNFYEIDINDPYKTKIYEVWNNCNNSHLASSFSVCDQAMYYSQIDSNLVTLDEDMNFCSVICPIGYNWRDFASSTEGNGSVCNIALDLDDDNSSMASGEYNYVDTMNCQLDSIFGSNADIVLRPSFLEFDSLVITQLDLLTELSLQTDYAGPLNINDSGIRITIFGNSPDNNSEEYINAVRSVRAVETGVDLMTPTNLSIGYQVFRDSISSDTAYAYIEIGELIEEAGRDLDTSFCLQDNVVNLIEIMDASDNGEWFPSLSNPPMYDPSKDNEGIYQYIVQGNLCPSDTAVLEVSLQDVPSIDLGPDILTCDESILLSFEEEENTIYEWNDQSMENSLEATESGVYYVTANNTCGSVVDSIDIGLFSAASIILSNSVVICTGDSVELDLKINTMDYDILWNTGSESASIYANEAGEYTVSVSNFCIDTLLEVEVVAIEIPLSIGNETLKLCSEETIEIGVAEESDIIYMWNNGSVEPTIEVEQEGLYIISRTNDCGTVEDSFYILEHIVPTNTLNESYELCDNNAITLEVTGSYESIVWNTGDTINTILVDEEGLYFVEVNDVCGNYIFETNVKICLNESIYIPDAFTPNQDGINDVFYIENPNAIEINECSIYDRWGSKLYTWNNSSDEPISWNGQYKDQQVQTGIYTYLLELGDGGYYTGTIMITR